MERKLNFVEAFVMCAQALFPSKSAIIAGLNIVLLVVDVTCAISPHLCFEKLNCKLIALFALISLIANCKQI